MTTAQPAEGGHEWLDVARYLERIGYTGGRVPTRRTLAALHEAHMLSVPFESYDCHLGRPVVVDPDTSFDKIVVRRRGGFCFELNGLFAQLLRALGFEVSLLAARPALGSAPPFSHMALLVTLPDSRWLADVGFGDSFLRPLDLDGPAVQVREQGRRYELRQRDGEWTMRQLWGSPPEGYTFSLVPRSHADFETMCRYYSTARDSNFVRSPVCSLARRDGRVTLAGGRLITTARGSRSEIPVAPGDERAVLERTFGVRL